MLEIYEPNNYVVAEIDENQRKIESNNPTIYYNIVNNIDRSIKYVENVFKLLNHWVAI